MFVLLSMIAFGYSACDVDSNCYLYHEVLENETTNVSIILTTQGIMKIPKALRININYIILFRPLNMKETLSFYDEFISYSKKEFFEILDYVYINKYDFLYINLLTNTYYKNFNRLKINKI